MPRPRRRPFLSLAVAAVAALALPAAAHAAAFTIAPGAGACAAPGDLACGSFTDAGTAADASAGVDTFSVAAGVYEGDGSFNESGVQITGDPGVLLNGSLTFNGTGASTLQRVNVARSSGAAPAIIVSNTGGLAISDLTAVSVQGDGIQLFNGSNKIERANIITAAGGADAIRVDANGTTVALTMNSSFATGGAAGIGVTTQLTGTATVNAHHVTAAGSTHGLLMDTTGPLLLGTGTATVNVSDSIMFSKLITDGVLATTVDNFDAATLQDPGAVSPDDLFADRINRNFRLKPGSPAIGAGGFTAGESTTDIDGEDRSAPPTDLGADEYNNTAPTAAIAVTTPLPRDGQPVSFDGSASHDQPGGGIASYHWAFGDGTTMTTTGPTVSHTYMGEGPVTAKLAVIDGEGAVSNVATTDVNILDGSAPTVKISKPKNNQKIFVFVRKTKTVTRHGKKVKIKVKTKKRTRIKFSGTAADKSGVARVFFTVQKVTGSSQSGVVTGSATSKCRWLDPKKGIKLVSCAKPFVISGKLKSDGTWSYSVKKAIKLAKGTYRVVVYGLDKTGAIGNSAAKADRNIKFKLK
jgi:PKD domain